MEKARKLGFVDYMVRTLKIKQEFFDQINTLVDWCAISNIINKHYKRGESAVGPPSYPGLVLFKMTLLQTWCGLSDYEVEERVNGSISFNGFVGISLDEQVPDHSVISLFRRDLTQKSVYGKLFKKLNKQLDKHKILVKSGAIVDASIVDSPLKPKGKATYGIECDRSEEPRSVEDIDTEEKEQLLIKQQSPGVDYEARWIKKGDKTRYGYKKHYLTDTEGLVLGVVTTPANVKEIANLEEVLSSSDLPENFYVYGDKGYRSSKNEDMLRDRKLKSRILQKAKKGKALRAIEKLRNKLIGKTRFKVERTFGSIRRWFNSSCAKYRGIAKMHTQNLMEAMAYNLYRSPGIVMSNALKSEN